MEGPSIPGAPGSPSGGRLLFWLIVAALPLLLYRLGAKDLWEASDARPLESAREMRLHRDALVQYTNGQVDLTKPPLYAWLAAAAFRMAGGESEWAGRLPSVFASLLILATTFVFARRAAGPRAKTKVVARIRSDAKTLGRRPAHSDSPPAMRNAAAASHA